jgi:hypothetical protein
MLLQSRVRLYIRMQFGIHWDKCRVKSIERCVASQRGNIELAEGGQGLDTPKIQSSLSRHQIDRMAKEQMPW